MEPVAGMAAVQIQVEKMAYLEKEDNTTAVATEEEEEDLSVTEDM